VTVLSASDVAAELKCRLPGLPVKKQHKLLYYCQGHHAAAFGTPLFSETISAWDMGPVVGQLWHQEREGTAQSSGALLPESALNTIGYVVSVYGGLSGKQLEILTHGETPWQLADQERRLTGHKRATITVESMSEFFRHPPTDEAEDESGPDDEALLAWIKGVWDRRAGRDPKPDDLDELRREIRLGA
jgi:uncharacterized phage-associated protein